MYTVALCRNGVALRSVDADKTFAGKTFAYFTPIAEGLKKSFPLDCFGVYFRDENGVAVENSANQLALAADGW